MEELIKIIKQLIQVFDEILPLEQKKLEAAKNEDILELEKVMNSEQALIMKLRGLELKRTALLAEKGWQNMTFRELVNKEDTENMQENRALLNEFANKLDMFKSANQAALDIININMRNIGKKIKKETGTGYDENGTPTGGEFHITDTRI